MYRVDCGRRLGLTSSSTGLVTGGVLFQQLPTDQSFKHPNGSPFINILKMMFSEHGIPTQVFTDQGSQFTPAEFWEFAKWYTFKILHSTPRYPQLNKLMVKFMKQIVRKADEAREDTYLVMLAYPVTMRGPRKLTPAEAMTQHKFRALLPVKQHLPICMSRWKQIGND